MSRQSVEGCCGPQRRHPKQRHSLSYLKFLQVGWMLFLLPFFASAQTPAAASQPLWEQAQKAFREKKYQRSLALTRQCLESDSGFAGYRMMEAENLFHLGKENFPEAIISYRKVLNLSPNSAGVYNRLFLLELKRGNRKEAKAYLLKGMKTEKDTATQNYFAQKLRLIQTLTLFKQL